MNVQVASDIVGSSANRSLIKFTHSPGRLSTLVALDLATGIHERRYDEFHC